MLPIGPAVILVTDPPMTRAAALVYRVPGGLGWLEPEYFGEQPPARSAWHEFEGEITDTDDGILLQGPEQTVLALDAERVRGQYPDQDADFARLEARLAELGTSLAEQRILVAAEVGASE
jgi:hypothetical protein